MTALADRPPGSPLVDEDGRPLDPPVQLSEHLLPPLKLEGIPFDEAWELAFERMAWPLSLRDAKDWRVQLSATRVVWQAAYEGWESERREDAIAALAHRVEEELGDWSEAA